MLWNGEICTPTPICIVCGGRGWVWQWQFSYQIFSECLVSVSSYSQLCDVLIFFHSLLEGIYKLHLIISGKWTSHANSCCWPSCFNGCRREKDQVHQQKWYMPDPTTLLSILKQGSVLVQFPLDCTHQLLGINSAYYRTWFRSCSPLVAIAKLHQI